MIRKTVILILLIFISLHAFADEGFSEIFGNSAEESSADNESAEESSVDISLSGNIGINSTFYFDDSWDSQRDFRTSAELDFMVSAGSAEAVLSLNVDSEKMNEILTLNDILDEISLRVFSAFAYFDFGLIKAEWGKGDGVHVIDPLNPIDQSSGISTDINEMKRSELMAKANIYLGLNGLLEIVYKPFFHPYSAAAEGRWAAADLSLLPNLQPAPDTENGQYWQAAARITGSCGPVDLGALYYYGYMPEPGYSINFLVPETNVFYTKAHLAGAELAAALGPFTLRTELGYWFSEDTEGTANNLYNDRFVWLGGMDYMIPGTTVFLSIQEFGRYVMKLDGLGPMDVDKALSYDGKAFTNTIAAALEGSFFRDVIKLRLGGMYVFESHSYVIMPAFFWYINDYLELSLDGEIFGGDDTGNNPYYAWDENDNLGISLHYIF